MTPTATHPHRCICAYCRQAHGWTPETIILKSPDVAWLKARGTASDVVERLIRDAQARCS